MNGLKTLMGRKVGGIPVPVLFTVGVLALVLYLRHRASTSATSTGSSTTSTSALGGATGIPGGAGAGPTVWPVTWPSSGAGGDTEPPYPAPTQPSSQPSTATGPLQALNEHYRTWRAAHPGGTPAQFAAALRAAAGKATPQPPAARLTPLQALNQHFDVYRAAHPGTTPAQYAQILRTAGRQTTTASPSSPAVTRPVAPPAAGNRAQLVALNNAYRGWLKSHPHGTSAQFSQQLRAAAAAKQAGATR